MFLRGDGVIVSSGKFKTKNGKEMVLVNIGEESTFTSFQFIGPSTLYVPEKGTRVEYEINLSKKGNYINTFLLSLTPYEVE